MITIRIPPSSTLFPYTTLFRSARRGASAHRTAARGEHTAGAARGGDLRDRQSAQPRRTVDHLRPGARDRKSTRLNSSHLGISYAVFCLKKKKPTYSKTPTKYRL